uniref:DNA-directed DNA polymerase n=1 Tax=uncultured bacterium lac160 TaxID=1447241 RepID=X2LBN4_9BACT|nr:DNA polymerase III subunit alpha [uncultured bacterium lac160]
MVHLHLHSHFSFGTGVSSPEVLAAAAAERGYQTLACTDINGVYGAVEFQRACEAAGVRPVLGAQLITDHEETVALATDERGWAALCRAISAIHWAEVEKREGSIVSLSGAKAAMNGHGSLPPRSARGQGDRTRRHLLSTLLAHDRDGLVLLSRDVAFLERVAAASGTRDLYAELIPGKERHAVLAAARRLGLPAAATNAVVMAHPEDWARHRLIRAIHLNTRLSELEDGQAVRRSGGHDESAARPADRPTARDSWLRPADDLVRLFPDCPEAVREAEVIAERCEYRIPIGRIVAPRLAEPDESFRRLRAFAYAGAERRYGTIAPVTRERLERELGIIAQKGFADYFLVVKDIVEHGPTHCGRGSVANSIVSYCLGITHVEPLGAGLLFERFLNPERRDPPDIDLDFPWDERDRVLAYVFRTYPRPQAAMVANHNCFRLRGALREVAKVHGRPAGEIREVTRRIPIFEDEPLEELLATHPNFQGLDLPPSWRDFARMAAPLVGVPRHLSVHPGGVVIVPTALTDYVPIEPAAKALPGMDTACPERSEGVPVIQFEKDGAEDAGLVKIDLLGNRSLAVIRDAIAAVERNTGHRIDYTTSDAGDDEATRALFRTGRTMGVFYTESPASRALCAKSRAETFDLLVLNTSIIRPASNRYIRTYLERLHGAPYEPLHPVLRDTLAETFGVMVYQEDVVNVCAVFAGMPLATADGLRKSLSKKRPAKQLAGYAEEFFAGALARGRDPETVKKVWEMIMSFAGYSFCKGHSASYIQVAQHSCYLRAHYPAEFMAAVLGNGGGFYHPFAYVAEAMRMGLTVHPPDVNASELRCTGRGSEVRIGLQFVKGLSAEGAERVLEARGACHPERSEGDHTEHGLLRFAQDDMVRPFRSVFDLQHRAGLAADDLRALIKVGALDSIAGDWTRPMMLWMVDAGQRQSNGRPAPAGGDWFDHLPPAIPVLRQYAPERRRREEYEALGFLTDTHPMRLHAERLARFKLCRSTELHRHVGRHVLLAGMLTTAKPVHTLQDEPMEFATFDDGEGLIETVLFPRVYRERGHVLFDQGPFIFRGKVEEEFGAITVTITRLDRLERAAGKA